MRGLPTGGSSSSCSGFPGVLTRPLPRPHFISCPSGICKLCPQLLAALGILQPETNDWLVFRLPLFSQEKGYLLHFSVPIFPGFQLDGSCSSTFLPTRVGVLAFPQGLFFPVSLHSFTQSSDTYCAPTVCQVLVNENRHQPCPCGAYSPWSGGGRRSDNLTIYRITNREVP